MRRVHLPAFACTLFCVGSVLDLQNAVLLATIVFGLLLAIERRGSDERSGGRLVLAVVMVAVSLLSALLLDLDIDVLAGIARYVGVVVLILAVSLFRLPLQYVRLNKDAGSVSHVTRLPYITALAGTVAPLLNLATLALFGGLLARTGEAAPRIPAAVTRGVGAAILVAPTFAPAAIVLREFPQATWLATLPMAAPLFLILLLSGFVYGREYRVVVTGGQEATLPFYHVPVLIGLMATIMTALRWFGGADIVAAVAIAAATSVSIWYSWMRPAPAPLGRSLVLQIDAAWQKMRPEAAVFLSAGLLAHVLAAIPPDRFSALLSADGQWLHHPMFALLVVIVGMPLITVLGIHPIVPFVALVHVIPSQVFGFDAAQMYMLWIVAWVLSMLISPVSALNLTAATAFHVSPVTVGLRENAVYAFGFAAVALTLFASLIR